MKGRIVLDGQPLLVGNLPERAAGIEFTSRARGTRKYLLSLGYHLRAGDRVAKSVDGRWIATIAFPRYVGPIIRSIVDAETGESIAAELKEY